MAQDSKATHYTVYFELADGEHIASKTIVSQSTPEATLELATRNAKREFKAGFRRIEKSTPEQFEKQVAELKERYKSRVPLDEKTGGVPNRVIDEPELAEDA